MNSCKMSPSVLYLLHCPPRETLERIRSDSSDAEGKTQRSDIGGRDADGGELFSTTRKAAGSSLLGFVSCVSSCAAKRGWWCHSVLRWLVV